MEGILRIPQGLHAVLHRGQGGGGWGGTGWWVGGVGWLVGGGGWVQLLSGATWLGLREREGQGNREDRDCHMFLG